MQQKRWLALLFAAFLLLPLSYAAAVNDAVSPDEAQAIIRAQQGQSRALLIGVDSFVSRPDIAPGSANNVNAMREMLKNAAQPFACVTVPDSPLTSPAQLTAQIRAAFGEAQEGDISYLYLSTHGVFEPPAQPQLLLSDGETECGVTPAQLENAFDGIPGTKVLILDACNSGAFIGKGMAKQPERIPFQRADFKVLTSGGAMEESWYWNVDSKHAAFSTLGMQGSFYFTQALTQSLSPRFGYPADRNSDGSVTLSELYEYLLQNHAASTPQVYPQSDDFVVFRYDTAAPAPADLSPVMDITFSGTMLSRASRQITIEFVATRPVRVAYQIVYRREGKWQFDTAQLIYDGAERYTAFGDRAGAVSPGRKVRALNLDELPGDSSGYVLVQLVTLDHGQLTVQAGRVISVPPESGDMRLSVEADSVFATGDGRELSLFVAHNYPCALSVAIVDESGSVVRRLAHRQSTRPMQLTPEGSVFYWDGRTKDGAYAPPGAYRVRVQAQMNDTTVTAFSSVVTVQ